MTRHFLEPYVAAAFPAVAINTHEDERCLREITNRWPERPMFLIAATGGLKDARTNLPMEPGYAYPQAFAHLGEHPEAILIVLDFQAIIKNGPAYRALKTMFARYKQIGSMVVLLAPSWSMPPEIQHDIPVIDFALPTREQRSEALDVVAESVGATLDPDTREQCLDATAGLTLVESENAYALAYVTTERFSPERILEEKLAQVRRSGLLEIFPAVSPDLVGGMGELKAYIAQEVIPNLDDGMLRVRGLLLLGAPGTGKSLAAKAIGAITGWPVLRCNPGNLKGSLLGESERNMKAMLALAEAIAPCVLFLDEAEKFYSGNESSGRTDGGTTSSMFSEQLTWMQEHRKPIITVITCNDYSKLPAELTRAGRIDERWYVDLPTTSERAEIAKIHLGRFGVEIDGLPGIVSEITHDWTGAEIEQLVKSAARRTQRQITQEALREAASQIKPISKVRAPEIKALRDWAKNNLRFANTPDTDQGPSSGRRLKVGA